MPTLTCSENTSFYQSVQNCSSLDMRDNRGKKHDLGVILIGVILGLLRGRDGNLSSIHRSMAHFHHRLCSILKSKKNKVVSRSHLPIVLSKVNRSAFETLLFEHYGLELIEGEKRWFAGDGKELRGSIAKGDKRGEALVQLVSHQGRQVVAQGFYQGKKESEKPTLRKLLKDYELLSQKISMDALHLNPKTVKPIAQAGGIFLVGLKANQEELEADMLGLCKRKPPFEQESLPEKGHGRLEKRRYEAYAIDDQYFDPRWEDAGFTTLVKVNRERTLLKTDQTSYEQALFISNAPKKKANELFCAIRDHWTVETNNHIRDVTLKEDLFRTKKTKSQKPWRHLEPSSLK